MFLQFGLLSSQWSTQVYNFIMHIFVGISTIHLLDTKLRQQKNKCKIIVNNHFSLDSIISVG